MKPVLFFSDMVFGALMRNAQGSGEGIWDSLGDGHSAKSLGLEMPPCATLAQGFGSTWERGKPLVSDEMPKHLYSLIPFSLNP